MMSTNENPDQRWNLSLTEGERHWLELHLRCGLENSDTAFDDPDEVHFAILNRLRAFVGQEPINEEEFIEELRHAHSR